MYSMYSMYVCTYVQLYVVFGTLCLVPGTQYLVPSSWHLVPSTEYTKHTPYETEYHRLFLTETICVV